MGKIKKNINTTLKKQKKMLKRGRYLYAAFLKKIRFKAAYPFQKVIVGVVCQVLYQMLPKLVKLNYKQIRLGNHLYLGAEMRL